MLLLGGMASYGICESEIPFKRKFLYRICRLLLDVGTDVLRKEFDNIHFPNKLDGVLRVHKSKLLRLPSNPLTRKMLQMIFPTDSFGQSTSFDLPTLSLLFLEICFPTPPLLDLKTGYCSWDESPLESDLSVKADLVRVKKIREEICELAKNTAISVEALERIQRDLIEILHRRGGSSAQERIVDVHKEPFTQIEEIYLKQLQDWCLHEKELRGQLKRDDPREQLRYSFVKTGMTEDAVPGSSGKSDEGTKTAIQKEKNEESARFHSETAVKKIREEICELAKNTAISVEALERIQRDLIEILHSRGGSSAQERIVDVHKEPFTQIEEIYLKQLQADWYLYKKQLRQLKRDDSREQLRRYSFVKTDMTEDAVPGSSGKSDEGTKTAIEKEKNEERARFQSETAVKKIREEICELAKNTAISVEALERIQRDLIEILHRRGGSSAQERIVDVHKEPFTQIEEIHLKQLQDDWYLYKKQLRQLKRDDSREQLRRYSFVKTDMTEDAVPGSSGKSDEGTKTAIEKEKNEERARFHSETAGI